MLDKVLDVAKDCAVGATVDTWGLVIVGVAVIVAFGVGWLGGKWVHAR